MAGNFVFCEFDVKYVIILIIAISRSHLGSFPESSLHGSIGNVARMILREMNSD